jgi:hypothetical protein
MKLDVPEDYLPLIVTALDNQSAYSRAVERDNSAYKEADFFRSKLPKVESEEKPRRPTK